MKIGEAGVDRQRRVRRDRSQGSLSDAAIVTFRLRLGKHGIKIEKERNEKDYIAVAVLSIVTFYANRPAAFEPALQKLENLMIALAKKRAAIFELKYALGSIPDLVSAAEGRRDRFEELMGFAEKTGSINECSVHMALSYLGRTISKYPQRYSQIMELANTLADNDIDPHSALDDAIPAWVKIEDPDPKRSENRLQALIRLYIAMKRHDFTYSNPQAGLHISSSLFAAQPDSFDLVIEFVIKCTERGMKPSYPFYFIPGMVEQTKDQPARFDRVLKTMLNIDDPQVANELFNDPEKAGAVLDLFGLRYIGFSNGGVSLNSSYLPIFLMLSGGRLYKEDILPVPERQNLTFSPRQTVQEALASADVVNPVFVRVHGRTLVFRSAEGKYIGVKLMKEGESEESLVKEARMLYLVEDNREFLGLKSAYPKVKMLCQIADVPSDYQTAVRELDKEGRLTLAKGEDGYKALLYEADESYFRFLNDPSLTEEAFRMGSLNALHDIFKLARYGIIHTSIIELFHDFGGWRPDGDNGRYIWSIDIARCPYSATTNQAGVGSLDAWEESVLHPNLRESGDADLADTAKLWTLVAESNLTSVHLVHLLRYGEYAPNYYLLEYLGEALLAMHLIVASRYKKIQWLHDPYKEAYIAGSLREEFATAFSAFSAIPFESVHAFLGAVVNWTRVSRQTRYFCLDNGGEDIKGGIIPAEIYGEQVRVEIDTEYMSSGWEEDLGPPHASNPLQDLITAFYYAAGFMIALRGPTA